MVGEKNRPKRVVWQDVMPSTAGGKPTRKKGREIRIVLPALPKLKVVKKIKTKLNTRRRRVIVMVILLVIAAAIVTFVIIHPPKNNNTVVTNPANSPGSGLVPGTPKYAVLLPAGKSLKDLGGGWVRDDAHPLFVYIDKIGATQVNISEQPLPDTFKGDVEAQVQQFAEAYGAGEKITLSGITVHIGTYGSGIQRAIFSKNNLLILITSTDIVSNNQWTTYVSSLN